jgi:hypothetical protein
MAMAARLAGMFDGATSPGLDFGARCVVLDRSAMYNSEAVGILMICAAAFQRAVTNDLRDRAEAGEQHTRKIISVYDECWKVIGQVGVGEWLQESFKLSRSRGTQNIIVIHRLTDLQAAGAAGSRERPLAEGLLADAETRVMYGQSSDHSTGPATPSASPPPKPSSCPPSTAASPCGGWASARSSSATAAPAPRSRSATPTPA